MSKLVESFFKEETAASLKLTGFTIKAKPVVFFRGDLSDEEADDRATEKWEKAAEEKGWEVRDLQPVSMNFINGKTRVDGEIECYVDASSEDEEDTLKKEALSIHFLDPQLSPSYRER